MLPWILLAISVALNVPVILYARSTVLDGKAAVDEAVATKKVYTRVLQKLERKFGEKKVARVANDVLREVTEEYQARENGSV
jgi:hypothetical protein